MTTDEKSAILSPADKAAIVGRDMARDLGDELEAGGQKMIEEAKNEREVVDGAEVPVRIKPKGAPALTLDALRRARKGA